MANAVFKEKDRAAIIEAFLNDPEREIPFDEEQARWWREYLTAGQPALPYDFQKYVPEGRSGDAGKAAIDRALRTGSIYGTVKRE